MSLPFHTPPRSFAQEYLYEVSFEGYPDNQAEWFAASRIRRDMQGGEQLIADYEVCGACGVFGHVWRHHPYSVQLFIGVVSSYRRV